MTNRILALDKDIWTVESSHKLLGINFGGRMTVIRLISGDLILHSPVFFENSLMNELNEIGVVKYIVAPNKFHHMHIGEYISRYPEAEVWCAPGLPKKRKDISLSSELTDEIPQKWIGEFECEFFQGIPSLNEVVFFHPSSRTVIFTDLLFNFADQQFLGAKIFTWLDGVYGKADIPRLIKWFMLRDRKIARESIKKILSWDFDRVSLTHKDMVLTGGKEIVAKAFESI